MDELFRRWIDAGILDEDSADADLVEILRWYAEVGIDPEGFEGIDPSDLVRTVNERMLRPGPRFTAEEARKRSGLGPASFARVLAATGYSMHDDFTQLDVDAFMAFGAGSELFTPDELLHFSRILSSAMARVAEASTSLFRIDVAADLEARGGSDLEWAVANYEAAQLIETVFIPLRAFFLHELQASVRRSDRGREPLDDSANASTLRMAVGFVDIVGYTPLAERLSPDELGRFVQQFEERANGVVVAHGGRVVKLIGDEVMFVAVDPGDACRIATTMIRAFDDTESMPRGGVAYGDVVARGGDYYGRIVNLASRIGDQAVPGEILVDRAIVDSVAPFSFAPAGRRELKGIAAPVPLWTLMEPARESAGSIEDSTAE